MNNSNNSILTGAKRSRFAVIGSALATVLMLVSMSGSALAEMINLNQASAETLEYIPGIGPAKARDIVEMRKSNQGFKTMEDLLSVKGIGEKTLELIRQHGSLDQGVDTLAEEMKANPPKRVTDASADQAASPETTSG